jgi:peptide/nickel transport system substrate-binding protein
MILTRPFRKPLWIVRSFLEKHGKLILGATLAGVLLFLAAKNFLPLLPRFKSKERIGFVGQYTIENLPYEISSTLTRGITKLDDSGQALPDIASKWEVLEENTLYRVYLRPDVFWSDGSALTSKDINLDLPDVTIYRPEPHLVEFKLKESYQPFIALLSQPLFKNNQFGASGYTIKSIKHRGPYLSVIELNGNDKNLIYRFYPSYESAWMGFKLGQVDVLKNLIVNPLDEVWQDKLLLTHGVNYHQYLAVIFNLSDPNLSSKPLRQALAYAIKNKSPMSESRALSPLSPQSWAYNSDVKPYEFNSSQANELFDRLAEEASISADFTIQLGTSQSFLPLAESIAASWREVLPIQVEVKIINSIESDFQAILIAQEIPLDPDQHALWHSTQETNLSHFSDLRVDKLLEDGRKTADLKKRKEIYLDFQRFLVEETPAIFLQYPATYTISRK